MMNMLPTNYSMVDTGLRFRGCPVFLGADYSGRTPDKLVLTLLNKFLQEHLSKDIVELLLNYSTGTLIQGVLNEEIK